MSQRIGEGNQPIRRNLDTNAVAKKYIEGYFSNKKMAWIPSVATLVGKFLAWAKSKAKDIKAFFIETFGQAKGKTIEINKPVQERSIVVYLPNKDEPTSATNERSLIASPEEKNPSVSGDEIKQKTKKTKDEFQSVINFFNETLEFLEAITNSEKLPTWEEYVEREGVKDPASRKSEEEHSKSVKLAAEKAAEENKQKNDLLDKAVNAEGLSSKEKDAFLAEQAIKEQKLGQPISFDEFKTDLHNAFPLTKFIEQTNIENIKESANKLKSQLNNWLVNFDNESKQKKGIFQHHSWETVLDMRFEENFKRLKSDEEKQIASIALWNYKKERLMNNLEEAQHNNFFKENPRFLSITSEKAFNEFKEALKAST